MSTREKLLADIEAFMKRHDMPHSTFGARALNDRMFVSRVRAGMDVRTRHLDTVRQFMADWDAANTALKKSPRARASRHAMA
jgi:predicted MarR family transcription regulator